MRLRRLQLCARLYSQPCRTLASQWPPISWRAIQNSHLGIGLLLLPQPLLPPLMPLLLLQLLPEVLLPVLPLGQLTAARRRRRSQRIVSQTPLPLLHPQPHPGPRQCSIRP